MDNNMEGYQFITMFVDCRSEEPESWEHGHNVLNTLADAGIETKSTYPDDVGTYERSVWVKIEDKEKAFKLLKR